MNPIPTLKHRAVRDLAWIINSQPLIDRVPNTPEDWWLSPWRTQDQTMRNQKWLQALDHNPDALLSHLEQQRSPRLGVYFEQLLSFYFKHAPRFSLLSHNLQVHNEGKTLGEYDFIVHDEQEQEVLHIEVAIKFYLNHTEGSDIVPNNPPIYDWHQWIGPNGKDSLALKLHHLMNKQLCLSHTNEGRLSLKKVNLPAEPLSSRLLLIGYLYMPLPSFLHDKYENTYPRFATPSNTNCYWWQGNNSTQIISSLKESEEVLYVKPPKHWWLSPILDCDIPVLRQENSILENSKQLLALIESSDYPTHFIKMAKNNQQQWEEAGRFFYIPQF